MTKKIVQVVTLGEGSTITSKEVEVVNRESKAYVEHHLYLEQYMTDVIKFNSDIEKYFSLLLG